MRQAANELDIALTVDEAERVTRSKAWQDVLWAERHKYNAEIANTPGRNKTSLVGQMQFLVQELIKAGEYDKALDGLQKLAKIEGWDRSDTINIFAGVSSADIEAQKKEIEKELLEQPATSAGSPKPN